MTEFDIDLKQQLDSPIDYDYTRLNHTYMCRYPIMDVLSRLHESPIGDLHIKSLTLTYIFDSIVQIESTRSCPPWQYIVYRNLIRGNTNGTVGELVTSDSTKSGGVLEPSYDRVAIYVVRDVSTLDVIYIDANGICTVPSTITKDQIQHYLNSWFGLDSDAYAVQITATTHVVEYEVNVSLPKYSPTVMKHLLMNYNQLSYVGIHNLVSVYEPYDMYTPSRVHATMTGVYKVDTISDPTDINIVFNQPNNIPTYHLDVVLPVNVALILNYRTRSKKNVDKDMLHVRIAVPHTYYELIPCVIATIRLLGIVYNMVHDDIYSMYLPMNITPQVSVQRTRVISRKYTSTGGRELVQPSEFYKKKGWTRFCQKGKQPIRASPNASTSDPSVLEFPPNSGQLWTCPVVNEYQYIGLKKNTLDSDSTLPYLPCCFKTPQYNRPHVKEYKRTGVLPKPIEKEVVPLYVMETQKGLTLGQLGSIPTDLHALVGNFDIVRLGVGTQTDSEVIQYLWKRETTSSVVPPNVVFIQLDERGLVHLDNSAYTSSDIHVIVQYIHKGTEFRELGKHQREVILHRSEDSSRTSKKVSKPSSYIGLHRPASSLIQALLELYRLQHISLSWIPTPSDLSELSLKNAHVYAINNYIVQIKWSGITWTTVPIRLVTPSSVISQQKRHSYPTYTSPVPITIINVNQLPSIDTCTYHVSRVYATSDTGIQPPTPLKNKYVYYVFAVFSGYSHPLLCTLVHSSTPIQETSMLSPVMSVLKGVTLSRCAELKPMLDTVPSISYSNIRQLHNEETVYVEGFLSSSDPQLEEYVRTYEAPSSCSKPEDAMRLIQHRLDRYHMKVPFELAVGDLTCACVGASQSLYTHQSFPLLTTYHVLYTPTSLPSYRRDYSFWIRLGDIIYLAVYVQSHAQLYESIGLDSTKSYKHWEYRHLSPIVLVEGETVDIDIVLFISDTGELYHLEQ